MAFHDNKLSGLGEVTSLYYKSGVDPKAEFDARMKALSDLYKTRKAFLEDRQLKGWITRELYHTENTRLWNWRHKTEERIKWVWNEVQILTGITIAGIQSRRNIDLILSGGVRIEPMDLTPAEKYANLVAQYPILSFDFVPEVYAGSEALELTTAEQAARRKGVLSTMFKIESALTSGTVATEVSEATETIQVAPLVPKSILDKLSYLQREGVINRSQYEAYINMIRQGDISYAEIDQGLNKHLDTMGRIKVPVLEIAVGVPENYLDSVASTPLDMPLGAGERPYTLDIKREENLLPVITSDLIDEPDIIQAGMFGLSSKTLLLIGIGSLAYLFIGKKKILG